MVLLNTVKVSPARREWRSAPCLLILAASMILFLTQMPGTTVSSRQRSSSTKNSIPRVLRTAGPSTQPADENLDITQKLIPSGSQQRISPAQSSEIRDYEPPAQLQAPASLPGKNPSSAPAAAPVAETAPPQPSSPFVAPVPPSPPASPPTTPPPSPSPSPSHPPAVDGLLSAPAAISGFMPKSSPTPPHYWLPANDSARAAEFDAWETATAAHPNASLAASWQGGVRLPNLPPLYLNCMVYVNHRYKFIYVRHPKSASSSVIHYFKPCGEPGVPGAVDKGGSNAQETAEQLGRLGVGAACLQPHRTFGAGLTAEDARAMWSDYFVFSVVRNPYARALSAYKFLLHKMRGDPGCPSVRWDAFCADPLSLGRACKRQPRCCPLDPWFYFHHVVDQGRCVTAEGGGWAVDYLVSLERLEEQMREVVAEIDRRRDPGLPPLANVTFPLGVLNQGEGEDCRGDEAGGELQGTVQRPQQDHVFGVPYNASVLLDRHCDPDDYYRGEHAHCLAQVRHFYHTDFQRMYAPHDALDPQSG